MPDITLRLRTLRGGVPTEDDPVPILAGSLPLVPVFRPDGGLTTAGAVLAGASVLNALVGPDADWTIPATATHVVVPPLSAPRIWSLPDVDGYPRGQDLVVHDEGRFLGGGLKITLIPLLGSGDSIPDYDNNQILLESAGASVRLRRGLLADTWGAP